MLGLVSRAHRGPRAEGLNLALHTRVPGSKWLPPHLSWEGHLQISRTRTRTHTHTHTHTGYLNSKWQRRAVCGQAVLLRCSFLGEPCPLPAEQVPVKQLRPQPVEVSAREPKLTAGSPFFDKRNVSRTSLVVQWLRLHPPNAGGLVSSPA